MRSEDGNKQSEDATNHMSHSPKMHFESHEPCDQSHDQSKNSLSRVLFSRFQFLIPKNLRMIKALLLSTSNSIKRSVHSWIGSVPAESSAIASSAFAMADFALLLIFFFLFLFYTEFKVIRFEGAKPTRNI